MLIPLSFGSAHAAETQEKGGKRARQERREYEETQQVRKGKAAEKQHHARQKHEVHSSIG